MALTPSRWIITYDISVDRDRRVVADILARYGQRVLYSVFDLPVTTSRAHRAFAEATHRCRAHDAVLMLSVCPRCREVEHGAPLEVCPQEGWVG